MFLKALVHFCTFKTSNDTKSVFIIVEQEVLNAETKREGQENRNEQNNQSLMNHTKLVCNIPVEAWKIGHNQSSKTVDECEVGGKPNSILLILLGFNLAATHSLDTNFSQTGFHFRFVALASSK